MLLLHLADLVFNIQIVIQFFLGTGEILYFALGCPLLEWGWNGQKHNTRQACDDEAD